MGFFDAVGDLLSAAMPWGEVEAEAPAKEEEEEKVCAIVFFQALQTVKLGLDDWAVERD